MAAMDIDDEGLDTTDRRLLAAIVQKFASGPVGGAAVAAVIGEEVETIEDVYEPYLLQLGFLDRTPQGRVATERAREHLRALGYDVPPPRRTDRVDPGLWDGVTVGRPDRERDDRVTALGRRPETADWRARPTHAGLVKRYGGTHRAASAWTCHVPTRRGLRLSWAQRFRQDHPLRLLPACLARMPARSRCSARRTRGSDRKRLFRVGSLIETPPFYPYLSGRDNLRVLAATGRADAAQPRRRGARIRRPARSAPRTRSRRTRWA